MKWEKSALFAGRPENGEPPMNTYCSREYAIAGPHGTICEATTTMGTEVKLPVWQSS